MLLGIFAQYNRTCRWVPQFQGQSPVITSESYLMHGFYLCRREEFTEVDINDESVANAVKERIFYWLPYKQILDNFRIGDTLDYQVIVDIVEIPEVDFPFAVRVEVEKAPPRKLVNELIE